MTAQQIADAIRAALEARAAAGATGNVTVTFDGISHTYSEAEARGALEYWERRAAREAGTRPIACTLDLRGQ
jgi:hypothetical protein